MTPEEIERTRKRKQATYRAARIRDGFALRETTIKEIAESMGIPVKALYQRRWKLKNPQKRERVSRSKTIQNDDWVIQAISKMN